MELTSQLGRILANRAGISDYQREEQEFLLRKQKALQDAQGNDPAAIKIANEIQKRYAAGDVDGARLLENTAKIYDKGIQFDPVSGQYIDMNGYAQGLGNLKYGENYGGESATQQVKNRYEPLRAEDIAQRQADVQIGTASDIEYNKNMGRSNAEAQSDLNKKSVNAQSTLDILAKAEEILPNATGSGFGSIVQSGKRFFGKSDDETKANKELELYSGWLVANVPRMEGPQSDFDVMNYKSMAADVGNTKIPVEDRMAALRGLRELQMKYADQQDPLEASRNAIMERNAQGIQNPYQTLPEPQGQPQAPKKGQVVNGYMFNGGDPSQQSSWKKVK